MKPVRAVSLVACASLAAATPDSVPSGLPDTDLLNLTISCKHAVPGVTNTTYDLHYFWGKTLEVTNRYTGTTDDTQWLYTFGTYAIATLLPLPPPLLAAKCSRARTPPPSPF